MARKTNAAFSKISFDHVHEQNKQVIKSRAGFTYSSLLNNDDTVFLRKMENVLPEICFHLSQIEGENHQNLSI